MAKTSSRKAESVDILLVDPPLGQVRMEIPEDGIRELAESIKSIGQLQPILVRPVDGRFEIVFGHRRFLACALNNASRIQAVVKELTDREVAIMRATENITRQDLSPIEEAAVYSDLLNTHGLTVDDIGLRMGKSPGVVRRRLDLLKMPPALQKAIHTKQINYGVGEALWGLHDLGTIDYYLAFAVEHGCTVAVARQWVRDEQKKTRTQDHDIAEAGGAPSPMEPRPVWVTCDLCLGPMELGKETVMRCCSACVGLVRTTLAASQQ